MRVATTGGAKGTQRRTGTSRTLGEREVLKKLQGCAILSAVYSEIADSLFHSHFDEFLTAAIHRIMMGVTPGGASGILRRAGTNHQTNARLDGSYLLQVMAEF